MHRQPIRNKVAFPRKSLVATPSAPQRAGGSQTRGELAFGLLVIRSNRESRCNPGLCWHSPRERWLNVFSPRRRCAVSVMLAFFGWHSERIEVFPIP